MVLIRRWLQNCFANHEECSQSNSSNLYPRRLLEISGDGTMPTLRVIACSDMSMFPYAALSYCWGGSQRVVLQRENYTALSEKLKYDALPQTVKGAVQITRNLGLGHLWIDALCLNSAPPFFKKESHCVWGLSRQLGLSERGAERSKARSQAKNPPNQPTPARAKCVVGQRHTRTQELP
jgi:hypothetical protein